MFFQLELGARRAARAERPHARRSSGALLPGPVTVLLANPAHRFPLACGPSRTGSACACRARGRARAARDGALAGAPVEREPRGRARRAPRRGRGRRLRAGVDLILDGGELPGTPSTVVDLSRGTEGGYDGARARGCAAAGRGASVPPMSELSPDYFPKPVAEVDPEIAEVLEDEAGPPGDDARDDRLRELRAAGGARLPGLGAHEQVRRGLPGQALLRRLRVRRRRRAARDRAREGALRRRARERAAARRRAGERRRLPRAARAGRPHPRHEARPRRPPHARDEDQLLRPPLRHRRLRRARGGLAARHGRARADRRGRQAEADPRRLVRLPAPARLPALPRDRRLGRRAPDGRHGALRRPRGGGGAPQPGAVRRRRHDHDAQDARRRARRHDPLPRGVRQEDRLGACSPASRAAR